MRALFVGTLTIALGSLLVGCGSSSANHDTGGASSGGAATGGAGGAVSSGTGGANGGGTNTGGANGGGAANTGGSTSTGGTSTAGSGLPVPPGDGVPKPSGTPGNLTVLDWAGFKAAVTYTFDDSQPSQIQHYAELQAMGVPLTFYINSGRNAEANYDATWTQAVKDGHEIGNHTVHHCGANLTRCSGTPLADQAAEIDQCTDYIIQHFGQNEVWTMATPYGDTGWDAAAAQRFLVNRGVPGGTIAPNDATDAFNLPIHLARANESATSFDSAIDGVHTSGRWLIFLVHTISPTADSWYNPIDISTITDSVAYAQSLSDVWIDTVVSVAAYWRAQKLLTGLTPASSGGNTTWSWTLPAHFPSGRYVRVTVSGGTLEQGGSALPWDSHGYYEVALDAGSLTLTP